MKHSVTLISTVVLVIQRWTTMEENEGFYCGIICDFVRITIKSNLICFIK